MALDVATGAGKESCSLICALLRLPLARQPCCLTAESPTAVSFSDDDEVAMSMASLPDVQE